MKTEVIDRELNAENGQGEVHGMDSIRNPV